MSESETNPDSAAQPTEDSSAGGIVITGGPGSASSSNEPSVPEPEVEQEAETEAEPDGDVDAAAETEADEVEPPEPSVDDEPADPDADVDVGDETDDEPAGESESESAVSAGGAAADAESDDSVPAEAAAEVEEQSVSEDHAEEEVSEPVPEADVETDTDTEATPDGDADSETDAVEDTDDESGVESEPAEAVEKETKATADGEESDDGVAFDDISGTPQTFSAAIKAGTLSNLLDSIDALVEECKVRVSRDGVYIRAVDAANVAMVDGSLDASAFEQFEASPGILGLTLGKLMDAVNLANKSDLIFFKFDSETRKLHIETDGLEYTMALLDPDTIRKEPEIPDLDLPTTVTLEAAKLSRAIKATDMVSDHISISTSMRDGGVLLMGGEGDVDDVELELGPEDLIDENISSEAKSLFSLDYMKDMNRAIPGGAEVTIDVGNEFPLKLRYEQDEASCRVEYMLAPRIQSD